MAKLKPRVFFPIACTSDSIFDDVTDDYESSYLSRMERASAQSTQWGVGSDLGVEGLRAEMSMVAAIIAVQTITRTRRIVNSVTRVS